MSDPIPPVPVKERVQESERHVALQDPIVAGLRLGDSSAWIALFDEYSERIWSYVAKLVGGDAATVCDIVQETMIAAAQSAKNFDHSKGTLWQWLSGIAHKRVAAHWRSEQRTAKLRQALLARGDLSTEATQSPAQRLDDEELADLVRASLARLPADYAALLTSKYIDGLNLTEIQRQTGSSSDAIRSKMVRARSAFRDAYRRIANCHNQPNA